MTQKDLSLSIQLKARLNRELKDWRPALARLEGAYADSTIRAYRADMEVFQKWCEKAGLAALPADPETVASFVAYQAERSAAASLKRRLAAIRKIHKLLRLQNPVADEEVAIALRRARRQRLSRPKQAMGLTSDLRDRLIAACPNTLIGLRDRALIALGYDTLCRRSELVALCIDDLVPSAGKSAQILIRRSKSDPYGNGRLGYVSRETLELLQLWLAEANIGKGYIFRAVYGATVGKEALHPFTVNRILKQAARAAHFPPEEVRRISGHSMRVGAAQDMIGSGLGILPIMQAGGWKSVNVVGRYVENANLSSLLDDARAREQKPS